MTPPDDLGPTYPAADITPSAPANGGGRSAGSGGRPLGALRRAWSTTRGRALLAGGAAIVLVVLTISRRQEATDPTSDATATTAATTGGVPVPVGLGELDDPFAGMGSNAIAQPIPPNGFQFIDGGGVAPVGGDESDVEYVPPAPPTPTHVVIDVTHTPSSPVVDTGGVSGSGAGSPGGGTTSPGTAKPTAPAPDRKPQGYYRAGATGGITYVDQAGHASSGGGRLSKAQIDGLGTVAVKVGQVKKPVDFVLDGINHTMQRDRGFAPAAYRG